MERTSKSFDGFAFLKDQINQKRDSKRMLNF